MTTAARLARSIALLALALAPACGGGGAAAEIGGPTVPPPPPPPSPPPQTSPPAPSTPSAPSAPSAPLFAVVTTPDRTFAPASVTIAAGGTVTWVMTDDDHDVTFTDARPAGGDIPETEEDESVSRTFSSPGTYSYRCSEHADDGMTGTVVVVAATTAPPGAGTPPPGGETPPPPPSGSTATVSTPGESFSPPSVTIAAGGTVTWNITGATHNVTFGATAPPGGNIPDTRGATVSRSFPSAGTYDYQCTRHGGMTGRVVVQ